LAALKAIASVREAYQMQEKINSGWTCDIDRKRWRERQALVEAELMKIAKLNSR